MLADYRSLAAFDLGRLLHSVVLQVREVVLFHSNHKEVVLVEVRECLSMLMWFFMMERRLCNLMTLMHAPTAHA